MATATKTKWCACCGGSGYAGPTTVCPHCDIAAQKRASLEREPERKRAAVEAAVTLAVYKARAGWPSHLITLIAATIDETDDLSRKVGIAQANIETVGGRNSDLINLLGRARLVVEGKLAPQAVCL